MSLRIILLLTLFWSGLTAQSSDSTFLSFEDYLNLVRSNHPVAQIAGIRIPQGDAGLLAARGAFDPVALGDFDQKYFEDSKYYRNFDGGVSIPTIMGLTIDAGYERASGEYLAPETTTPGAGLIYAGAKLTLGQGLLIDKRRAQLQMAEIYQQSTDAERRVILNDLLYEAGTAYWDWYYAYLSVQIFEDAYDAAVQRLDAVRGSVEGGERPAVDTLEAGIQVQNRELSLRDARMEYFTTSANLAAYVWSEVGEPMMLNDNTFPAPYGQVLSAFNRQPTDLLQDTLIANHPELILNRFEIDRLEVERRLKREQLKPIVDLKYNAIAEPINGNPFTEYSINNYKWGVSFKMPLLLRRERGEVQLADLKIEESVNKLENKQAMLNAKSRQAILTWEQTQEQIELYTRTVSDYGDLLEAERIMFDAGESSLFMVNARELGFINSQVTLIKLEKQLRKADLQIEYALGRLQ